MKVQCNATQRRIGSSKVKPFFGGLWSQNSENHVGSGISLYRTPREVIPEAEEIFFTFICTLAPNNNSSNKHVILLSFLASLHELHASSLSLINAKFLIVGLFSKERRQSSSVWHNKFCITRERESLLSAPLIIQIRP